SHVIAASRSCLPHTFRPCASFLDLAFRDVTLSHCSVNSGGEQQIDFIAGFSSHETSNFLVILETHECPTKHWGDRFVWRYHGFDEVGHVESAASAREARAASAFIT